MTTVYEVAGFQRRQTISMVVLVIVTLYGFWELWTGLASGDTTALIFAFLFFAGAGYGYWTITTDSANAVIKLEETDDGQLAATLWRPTGSVRIASPPEAYTNWRPYVRIAGRNIRKHFLFADHPDHPAPLEFELRPEDEISPRLRELAPEAIAEYEENTGRNSAD